MKKEIVGIKTDEALKITGIPRYSQMKKICDLLGIQPKRYRGESSYRWTVEQVNLIGDYYQISKPCGRTVKELDVIEYYLEVERNIHRISKHFKVAYNTIYLIVNKYEREKCVIVESNMNYYGR